jgi:glucose/arabinose dehydrogenase
MKLKHLLFFAGIALLFSSGVCYPPALPSKTDLSKLKLPEGFKIEVYAEEITNARSLTKASDKLVFVSTRQKGWLHALVDNNGDYRADEHIVLHKDLDTPNGVVFHKGDLYVAELSRIIVFRNIEKNLKENPPFEVVLDGLPTERHHGWKYMALGPDEKLYFTVGAPCNVCERKEEVFASICRVNLDGTGMEVYAHGARNSVGFDWHPQTKELWFTDNGRDMMGDDMPGDELNHAPKPGMHFGFPYCHQGNTLDPEHGAGKNCNDYTPPAQILGAHVASLGMSFYTGKMFPASYKDNVFIAEHGSWNRSKPSGYRITNVKLKDGKAVEYSTFIEGWLDGSAAWGRPVDVMQMGDGSLLISDDHADIIYRVSYKP